MNVKEDQSSVPVAVRRLGLVVKAHWAAIRASSEGRGLPLLLVGQGEEIVHEWGGALA